MRLAACSFMSLFLLFSSSSRLLPGHVVQAGSDDEYMLHDLDLGTHSLGEKVKSQAAIRNDTGQVVTILQLRSSCGCTKAEPAEWTIRPGQTVPIEIVVDSLGREGDFTGAVLVSTDSPVGSVHKIRLRGKFVASDHNLVVRPQRIRFGALTRHATSGQVLTISRRGRVPVGDIQVVPGETWITAEIDRARSTEDTIYVTVAVHVPTDTIGRFKTELTIHRAGHPDDFVRVPISANAMPPIVVSPQMIMVQEDHQEHILHVRSDDGAALALETHAFSGDGLMLTFCSPSAKRPGHIVLKFRRMPGREGFVSGMLTLRFQGERAFMEVKVVSPPLADRVWHSDTVSSHAPDVTVNNPSPQTHPTPSSP